ncbi:hypothetical protein LG201_08155 [Methylobacillus gramineus]|uniref:hypothetical protein n=1 Tax=Methylobacillus gramineus TaxID=755169 RepID=UPI001CFFD317|nr:hypothetical protein [Methylobacillus gramineus]MCB5185175.1 hypothetical protein [Methylobacillus gramineus]
MQSCGPLALVDGTSDSRHYDLDKGHGQAADYAIDMATRLQVARVGPNVRNTQKTTPTNF